jgi:hypothetical protein
MKSQNLSMSNWLKCDKVLNCVKELHQLSKTKNPKQKEKLIKEAQACVINAISEIAKNCLLGNIPLTSCSYKQLAKYQKVLRAISKKSASIKRRKDLIIQNGGFLSLLIPPALSLIASVVGNLINKRINHE